MARLNPVHPGEVLMEEFLKPMQLSQNRLAIAIGVPAPELRDRAAKRSISADTALRLARYFGNSAQFWLGLQMDYDLDLAGGAWRKVWSGFHDEKRRSDRPSHEHLSGGGVLATAACESFGRLAECTTSQNHRAGIVEDRVDDGGRQKREEK